MNSTSNHGQYPALIVESSDDLGFFAEKIGEISYCERFNLSSVAGVEDELRSRLSAVLGQWTVAKQMTLRRSVT